MGERVRRWRDGDFVNVGWDGTIHDDNYDEGVTSNEGLCVDGTVYGYAGGGYEFVRVIRVV